MTAVIVFVWSLFIRRLPDHDPVRFNVVGALLGASILLGMAMALCALIALVLTYHVWHSEPIPWI